MIAGKNDDGIIELQYRLASYYRLTVEDKARENIEASRTPTLEKQGVDELLLAFDNIAAFDGARLSDERYRASLRTAMRLFQPGNFADTDIEIPAYQRSNATLKQFHKQSAGDPIITQGLAELAGRVKIADEQDIIEGRSFLERLRGNIPIIVARQH